ncbi:hypothetical protein [Mangrovibacterium diazotrophicum]|uniref:Lipocalin-like protein n=1 Tax=Mangrovibacterium diazotrophicum TaxID=1261403 RepID=A0A419VYE1_9BACT|nr:hypothetical protein [Mangrovibacterium diazotrophicum]RKD88257.1 hypothetical protein BC643_3402 [Mangrovibacterium diazotrophicum]
MRTILKFRIIIPILFATLMVLSSCKENPISTTELDDVQLVAGRIDGTWGDPSGIETPDDLPTEIFGDMRLVFTTDNDGYPARFVAKDCPIVFSSSASTWSVSGTESSATVSLTDVSPVDEIAVVVTGTTMTISFYMGWENTETGETGQGDFRVTLTRL